MVFNNYLQHWFFPTYFHFFILLPISPIFLSCLVKKTVGMSGKGQAFGFYRFWFFEFLPSLWASWVVLAAVFWEVQGISNTPKIISQRTFFGCGLQTLMRSWCNLNWREILGWLGGSTHETWCLNLFALPDLQRIDLKKQQDIPK